MRTHDYDAERKEMVDRVEQHFRETAHVTGLTRMGDDLAAALLRVPRHRFVPAACQDLAYADSALSIGFGQTISQPFIVALMIELAKVTGGSRVLEVGTGCGYEAAVLSTLGALVHTIERCPELAFRSSDVLRDLAFGQIQTKCGDGFAGWSEASPFDSILVTACSPVVPEPLVTQLAVGGRLVIPVGLPRAYQELQVIEKVSASEVAVRHGLPVAFVPLVHDELKGPIGEP